MCTSNEPVGEGGATKQDVHPIAVSKEHTMRSSRFTELQVERVKPICTYQRDGTHRESTVQEERESAQHTANVKRE